MQQYQEKEKKRKKEQQQKQAEEQVRSSGYNRYDINEKQLWRTKLKGTGKITSFSPDCICACQKQSNPVLQSGGGLEYRY